MNNIFILIDCPLSSNDKSWIERITVDGYNTHVIDVKYKLSQLVRNGKWGKVKNYFLQIQQVWRVLKMSDKNDVIVVWYSVTGQIMNMVSDFWGSRNLILMNFLTPMKRLGILDWMLKKTVFNQRNTILVNTLESEERYKELFHLTEGNSARFCWFPDVYDDVESFTQRKNGKESDIDNPERYFFTGGMTNRNWKLLSEVARQLPKVNFVCCALKDDFEEQVQEVPQNIKAFYNVSPDKYYQLMTGSHCVLLPLKNDAVAGLINIIKAVQKGIICCVSNTPATRQYYSDDNKRYLLDEKVEAWVDQIRKIDAMSDNEYNDVALSMQDYLQSNFSPNSAIKRLETIIQHSLNRSIN